jgi:hypothetical protein
MTTEEILWCSNKNCESPNYASSIRPATSRPRPGSRGVLECVTCHTVRDETTYLREDPNSPISLNELEEVVGKTWALNLVDRSSKDQLVFFALVKKGYSYDQAWQGMAVTAPVHNNQGLSDTPMGPGPERTGAV